MTYRTAFEVGWNNMAYAINIWQKGCCFDHSDETREQYVERCRAIAAKTGGDQNEGSLAAAILFLNGGVDKLAYKGNWNPPS